MKFDRNILEKLVETNAEAYSLLHYQYTTLDTRYNQLENEYRETVRRLQESNLVPLENFTELKDAYSQAAMLLAQAQEELNVLDSIKEENVMLKTNLHDLEHDYLKATESRESVQKERNALKRTNDELSDIIEALRHDVRVGHERIADLEHSYKVSSEAVLKS